MRLLIIRHGDPDYEKDSLTEKGWREAALLAERISKLDVAAFYVSPLGRARDTASLTLQRMNREAVECDWLKEFPARISRPDMAEIRRTLAWDWLPQDWTGEEAYFRREEWAGTEVMREGGVAQEYEYVIRSFDGLLAEHGYVRDGEIYRAERPNRDTIVFFCHFGLECVPHDTLASHLRRAGHGDHGGYGRAQTGNSRFQDGVLRGYFPLLCCGGRTLFFGQVL